MQNTESNHIVIEPADAGLRLDKLLANKYPEQSRAYFQYLIESGLVLLNGSPVKKRAIPKEGDEIEIEFALTPELAVTAEPIPLDIIYEDEYLLAVNKPAGMVVHPAAGNWTGTFVNALLYHCKELDSGDSLRPGIVHRLDKETSGVLLAAKTTGVQQKLVSLFASRSIKKSYLAVTVGNPGEGTIDLPIGRHPVRRKEMAIVEVGKAAVTDFKTIGFVSPLALVMLHPLTGRTHQIRVHMRSKNCPILGDSVYGKIQKGIERQLLHAYRIEFIHPVTEKRLVITAPLPPDFADVAAKIYPNYLDL